MKKNNPSTSNAVWQSIISENLNSGDYNSVISAVPEIMRLGSYTDLVPLVIKAALALNTIEAIESAVGLAIACDSNERQRAQHALSFATGGWVNEAFVVLFADPQIHWFQEHLSLISPVMSMIGRSMNAATPAARAAERFRLFLKKRNPPQEVSPDQTANRKTRSQYGFTEITKNLQQQFRGPPIMSFIDDPSLGAQQAAFKRALRQTEEEFLSHNVLPVLELRDVFMNRYGDLWKADGSFLKNNSGSSAVLPGPTSPIQSIDILIAAANTEASKNPYLWFARFLPSLAWRWDMADIDIPIGISDTASAWVADSIRMASKVPPTIISVGDAVFVKRLVFCRPHLHFLGRHEAYQSCFERIFERVAATGVVANKKPIYMSRRDAKRRAMANELALEEALAARGVKPIMLTGLSFAEKVSLFRDAPLIIGAHGAGFGTLVFSKPGRNVIEILPAYTPFTSHTQFTHHRTNLPNVSRIIGHNHYHYLALPKKSIDGQGWGLDIPKFLEFFDQHFG
jgi:hypothetical protein